MKGLASLFCLVLLPAAFPATTNDAGSAGADYRLAPRDSVQLQIYNQPDMTTVQRVTSSGEVRLPLIGTVRLAGITLREAERLLETRYREGGYFVAPEVLLSVQEYGGRFVAVLGQVKEPARIPLPNEDSRIGLLHALTQAGGLTAIARTDAVQVLRTGTDGTDQRFTINLDDMIRPKGTSPVRQFELLPGDIVFVPERTF